MRQRTALLALARTIDLFTAGCDSDPAGTEADPVSAVTAAQVEVTVEGLYTPVEAGVNSVALDLKPTSPDALVDAPRTVCSQESDSMETPWGRVLDESSLPYKPPEVSPFSSIRSERLSTTVPPLREEPFVCRSDAPLTTRCLPHGTAPPLFEGLVRTRLS